jgi:hypothetical protein
MWGGSGEAASKLLFPRPEGPVREWPGVSEATKQSWIKQSVTIGQQIDIGIAIGIGVGPEKLDPDSDTDTDPEGYSFCIAIRTVVTGQRSEPPAILCRPSGPMLCQS